MLRYIKTQLMVWLMPYRWRKISPSIRNFKGSLCDFPLFFKNPENDGAGISL